MSLDVPEKQILIYFAADHIPWHHRVLLQQIEAARWVVATPDLEVEVVDLAAQAVRALGRNGAFPAGIGNIYGFDNPIAADDLASIRLEGQRLAAVMGAPARPVPGVVPAACPFWR
jgi:hypothetical protein